MRRYCLDLVIECVLNCARVCAASSRIAMRMLAVQAPCAAQQSAAAGRPVGKSSGRSTGLNTQVWGGVRKLGAAEAAWVGGFLSYAAWLRERYPDARLFSRFTASPPALPQPQPHSPARSPPITLVSLPRPTLKFAMGFTLHEWGSGCV